MLVHLFDTDGDADGTGSSTELFWCVGPCRAAEAEEEEKKEEERKLKEMYAARAAGRHRSLCFFVCLGFSLILSCMSYMSLM